MIERSKINRWMVIAAASVVAFSWSACTAPEGDDTGGLSSAGTGVIGTAGMNGASGTSATAGTGSVAGTSSMSGAGGEGGAAAVGGDGASGSGVVAGPCDATGACMADAPGVYALKAEIDVWWEDEVNNPATPLVDPGRGKIVLYLRADMPAVCGDGSKRAVKLHPCGTTLPTFVVDVNCKAIHISFDDALWDKPTIPDYDTTMSLSGFDKGAMLDLEQAVGLLGIQLKSADAAWPAAKDTVSFDCGGKTGIDCFPDQDDDKHPGVTVKFSPLSGKYTMADGAPYKCGTGADFEYSSAPLSIGAGAFGAAGAEYAYFGTRISLGGQATVAECGSGAGPAATTATVPSRVIDCVLEQAKGGNGVPCMAADAEFIDQNTPNYRVLNKGETPPDTWVHIREKTLGMKDPGKNLLDRTPSQGTRFSLVRIADSGSAVTCGDVRGASFPAFN